MSTPARQPDSPPPTTRPDAPSPFGTSSPTPRPGASSRGYPPAVNTLIERLAALPGIGSRSAERLALFLLKSPREDALALARAIGEVKSSVRNCGVCSNLTDDRLCAICSDDRRERSLVMVVEQPRDVLALEQTGAFKGVYHVLLGLIAPLDGVGPSDLTIDQLVDRCKHPAKNVQGVAVREVVLGLNPTLEGDGTALYLAERLKATKANVTRLARGLPTGSSLEFVNKAVLSDAIHGRRQMD